MSERDDAAHIEFLTSEIEKLRAQVKDRDVEIGRLKKEKGLSSARDGLAPNDKTGTWVETVTGKHHCTRCLLKDDKRVPLKTEPHGWCCMLCAKYYADPDRPERSLDYDPNQTSWS